MSTSELVIINGQEYFLVFREDRIIEIKKFNTTHGMWLKITFSEQKSSVEAELLQLLKSEYINQVLLKQENTSFKITEAI